MPKGKVQQKKSAVLAQPKPVKGERKATVLASAFDIASIKTAIADFTPRLNALEEAVTGGAFITKNATGVTARAVTVLSKRIHTMEKAGERVQERAKKLAGRLIVAGLHAAERKQKQLDKALAKYNAARKAKGLNPIDADGKEVKS